MERNKICAKHKLPVISICVLIGCKKTRLMCYKCNSDHKQHLDSIHQIDTLTTEMVIQYKHILNPSSFANKTNTQTGISCASQIQKESNVSSFPYENLSNFNLRTNSQSEEEMNIKKGSMKNTDCNVTEFQGMVDQKTLKMKNAESDEYNQFIKNMNDDLINENLSNEQLVIKEEVESDCYFQNSKTESEVNTGPHHFPNNTQTGDNKYSKESVFTRIIQDKSCQPQLFSLNSSQLPSLQPSMSVPTTTTVVPKISPRNSFLNQSNPHLNSKNHYLYTPQHPFEFDSQFQFGNIPMQYNSMTIHQQSPNNYNFQQIYKQQTPFNQVISTQKAHQPILPFPQSYNSNHTNNMTEHTLDLKEVTSNQNEIILNHKNKSKQTIKSKVKNESTEDNIWNVEIQEENNSGTQESNNSEIQMKVNSGIHMINNSGVQEIKCSGMEEQRKVRDDGIQNIFGEEKNKLFEIIKQNENIQKICLFLRSLNEMKMSLCAKIDGIKSTFLNQISMKEEDFSYQFLAHSFMNHNPFVDDIIKNYFSKIQQLNKFFESNQVLYNPYATSRSRQYYLEKQLEDILKFSIERIDPEKMKESQSQSQKIDPFESNPEYNDMMSYYNNNPAKIETIIEKINCFQPYLIEFDGASKGNPGRSGAGFLIKDPLTDRSIVEYSVEVGIKTCNQAEYLALVYGMYTCYKLGIRQIRIQGDSEVIIKHMLGVYQVRSLQLKEYYNLAKMLGDLFHSKEYVHVKREFNLDADALANQALI